MKNLILSVMLVVVFGCQPKKADETGGIPAKVGQEPNDIVGLWSNVSMKVIYGSIDSTAVVNEGEWEAVLGIKPIFTSYTEEGNYTSEYRNLNDSLVNVSKGQWSMNGDTLSLTEAGMTTKYHFVVDGNVGRFTAYLDWDQDGEANDLYIGIQKKH